MHIVSYVWLVFPTFPLTPRLVLECPSILANSCLYLLPLNSLGSSIFVSLVVVIEVEGESVLSVHFGAQFNWKLDV